MTFGKEGQEQSRVHDLKDVAAILEAFKQHGHVEVSYLSVYYPTAALSFAVSL